MYVRARVCVCFSRINKLTQNAFNYSDARKRRAQDRCSHRWRVRALVFASIHISNVCIENSSELFHWLRVQQFLFASSSSSSSSFFFFFVVAARCVSFFCSCTLIRSIEEYVWFHNALKLYVKLCTNKHTINEKKTNRESAATVRI